MKSNEKNCRTPIAARNIQGKQISVDFLDRLVAVVMSFEIKHSSAPSPSRGFHEGCKDIQATRQTVVYPGMETCSIKYGVEVLPITQLMSELGERL